MISKTITKKSVIRRYNVKLIIVRLWTSEDQLATQFDEHDPGFAQYSPVEIQRFDKRTIYRFHRYRLRNVIVLYSLLSSGNLRQPGQKALLEPATRLCRNILMSHVTGRRMLRNTLLQISHNLLHVLKALQCKVLDVSYSRTILTNYVEHITISICMILLFQRTLYLFHLSFEGVLS